jgi:hypothetical protein
MEKLISTFQLKLLNQFFIPRLIKQLPSAVIDNEQFFKMLCCYALPDVILKVLNEVRGRRKKLVDRSIMNLIQSLFKDIEQDG